MNATSRRPSSLEPPWNGVAWLDLLSCALGAFLLLLLVFAIQASGTDSADSAQLAGLREEAGQLAREIGEMEAEEPAARDAPSIANETLGLERRLDEIAVRRAELYAAAAPTLFTAANPRPPADPEPRILLVHDGRAIDVRTGESFQGANEAFYSYLRDLRERADREYPLFLVTAQGVEIFAPFEALMRRSRMRFGYEPYSRYWEPSLRQAGREGRPR